MLKPFLSSSNEDLIIIGSCYLPPVLLAHSRGKLGCLRKAAECLGISEGGIGTISQSDYCSLYFLFFGFLGPPVGQQNAKLIKASRKP